MQRSLDEGTSRLETVLPEVLARVIDLERRVAALENPSANLANSTARVEVLPALEIPPAPTGIIPALGTALLGLAGAYLLRAIAESGAAPRIATVIAALIYAGGWLVWPIRPPPAESFRTTVRAVTASLIFAPLLWETTVRFQVLPPAVSALIVVLFFTAGYILDWRRNRAAISRITTLAGAGTALVLLVATRDLAPFTLALLAMAAVAEYAASRDRRLGIRWTTALSCDVSLMLLPYVITRPQGLPEGYRAIPVVLVLAIQVAALAIYLASTSFRALVRGFTITWFEVAQTTAIFVVSVGGLLQVTRGAAGAAAGSFCMLGGIAAYLAAFAILDIGRRTRQTYATWGLTLLLGGSAMLFSAGALTAIWAALAILAMSEGRRAGQTILRAHACVYLIGAGLVSGLLRYCYAASIQPETVLAAVAPAAVLAAGAAALCYAASGATPTVAIRISAAIVAGLLCWSVMAFGFGMLAALKINVASLATLRTALVCAMAIGIAFAGARWGRGELLWLQYPVMLFAAAKLLLEDFHYGNPASLALSLLSCGGALILLPRCRQAEQDRERR